MATDSSTDTSRTAAHTSEFSEFEEGDINLVSIWLKTDPVRWVAGAMAGIFAGAVTLVFAGLLASTHGMEFLFPAKIAAIPFMGNVATETGMHMGPIGLGILVHEVLCAVIGAVYAHFTGTNSFKPLLAAGLMWGIFSWVFICNLMSQSFTAIRALELPHNATFLSMLVFGVMLSSTGFFDRALRRGN
ncbi:MAG: hypothetical protein H7222_11145 [Methylotenera sp.]|nr:hypothetical protein [Oligoflexia bacterium]